jgi:transcriptional regulator with XRE-family HTH domain
MSRSRIPAMARHSTSGYCARNHSGIFFAASFAEDKDHPNDLGEEEIKRVIDPMESFHLQLKEEVESYERLKRGGFEELENFRGFGHLLISLRIAKGMSQRELAKRLAVHESQVSRDERHEYFGITLERAVKILDALNVRLRTTPALELLLQVTQFVPRFVQAGGRALELSVEQILIERDQDRVHPRPRSWDCFPGAADTNRASYVRCDSSFSLPSYEIPDSPASLIAVLALPHLAKSWGIVRGWQNTLFCLPNPGKRGSWRYFVQGQHHADPRKQPGGGNPALAEPTANGGNVHDALGIQQDGAAASADCRQ